MQLTLQLEPGLTARFRTLKQVCAHVVYASRGGLAGVAGDLDMSPSELSKRLSEEDNADNRPLRDEDIVGILESTKSTLPVLWLIERFMQDPKAKRDAAIAQLAELVPVINALAEQAGVVPKGKTR